MDEWIRLAKALSDESRVRTLLFLQEGDLCACRIIKMLDLAPSTVSAHMAILQRAGLVEVRKDGRWRHYRLAGRTASPLAKGFVRFLRKRLADDPTFLEDKEHLAELPAPETLACA